MATRGRDAQLSLNLGEVVSHIELWTGGCRASPAFYVLEFRIQGCVSEDAVGWKLGKSHFCGIMERTIGPMIIA